MDPQAYNSPTYTYTNTYTCINNTLIPTYTYINNNPYSTTPHNNHLPFYLLPLACQHKQHKQCKQTHQHYCSKTVITFLIIHYQVLRHQECVHSQGVINIENPFMVRHRESVHPFLVCAMQAIFLLKQLVIMEIKSKHALHIEFNNLTCIFLARVTEHLAICRCSIPSLRRNRGSLL